MVPSRIIFPVHTKNIEKTEVVAFRTFFDDVSQYGRLLSLIFFEVHGKKSFRIVRLKLHFELI